MINNIRVAIFTKDREEFCSNLIQSLKGIPNLNIVVYQDGGKIYEDLIFDLPKENFVWNRYSTSKGITLRKNEALRDFVHGNYGECEYVFLLEDDIQIMDPKVFEKYILTAHKTGLWHLNYGYHGPANKDSQGNPLYREIVPYEEGIEIALNKHCVGAFSFYHKNIFKKFGYYSDRFRDNFDHVEHTYRLCKARLHSPFWWFADVANSWEMIRDQDPNLLHSTTQIHQEEDPEIKKKKIQKFQLSAAWFKELHGYYPTQVPDSEPQQVLKTLEFIKEHYSRPL